MDVRVSFAELDTDAIDVRVSHAELDTLAGCDVRVSHCEFDTAAGCDVRVSWCELDTTAACDVRVSWCEFDPQGATCDVRVSWCEFDSDAVEPLLASLGAAPRSERRRKPQDEREDDLVAEAIPPAMVSRIRDEMLSASLAADVVERAQLEARKAKRRKEAAILLLMSV